MDVSPITSKTEIASSVRKIKSRFRDAGLVPYRNHVVGTPGGAWSETLYWSPVLEFWGAFRVNPDGNWHDVFFGISDPQKSPQVGLTAKASIYTKGVNRIYGGLIVKDSEGRLFLVHSGKIAGGKIGVGKELFWKKYHGGVCNVAIGSATYTYALVGKIEGPDFIDEVSQFVNYVASLKANQKKFTWRFGQEHFDDFAPEKGGVYGRLETTVERSHQLIVNALAKALERSAGAREIANDDLRDLRYRSGGSEFLFEVKTDIDRQSIYTAVGQLLLNDARPELRRILVAPKGVKGSLELVDRLSALGIELLCFSLDLDRVTFHGIEKILEIGAPGVRKRS